MASKGKKLLVAGLCAATLGGSLVPMSTSAEAAYRRYGHHPGYTYRRHHSGRNAAIAAGVVGGLALGALATGAARAAPVGQCYEVRRRFVDDWGRTFVRRETVCE